MEARCTLLLSTQAVEELNNTQKNSQQLRGSKEYRKLAKELDPMASHLNDNCRIHHSNTGGRRTLSRMPKFVRITVKIAPVFRYCG